MSRNTCSPPTGLSFDVRIVGLPDELGAARLLISDRRRKTSRLPEVPGAPERAGVDVVDGAGLIDDVGGRLTTELPLGLGGVLGETVGGVERDWARDWINSRSALARALELEEEEPKGEEPDRLGVEVLGAGLENCLGVDDELLRVALGTDREKVDRLGAAGLGVGAAGRLVAGRDERWVALGRGVVDELLGGRLDDECISCRSAEELPLLRDGLLGRGAGVEGRLGGWAFGVDRLGRLNFGIDPAEGRDEEEGRDDEEDLPRDAAPPLDRTGPAPEREEADEPDDGDWPRNRGGAASLCPITVATHSSKLRICTLVFRVT